MISVSGDTIKLECETSALLPGYLSGENVSKIMSIIDSLFSDSVSNISYIADSMMNDSSESFWLNMIAEYLGIADDGFSDDEKRNIIKAFVASNYGSGNNRHIYSVVSLMFPDSSVSVSGSSDAMRISIVGGAAPTVKYKSKCIEMIKKFKPPTIMIDRIDHSPGISSFRMYSPVIDDLNGFNVGRIGG